MNLRKITQIISIIVSMIICLTLAGNNVDAQAIGEDEIRYKRHGEHGVTGPVHTFVKTDKHSNFKWGVRHHVGHHYAGRR